MPKILWYRLSKRASFSSTTGGSGRGRSKLSSSLEAASMSSGECDSESGDLGRKAGACGSAPAAAVGGRTSLVLCPRSGRTSGRTGGRTAARLGFTGGGRLSGGSESASEDSVFSERSSMKGHVSLLVLLGSLAGAGCWGAVGNGVVSFTGASIGGAAGGARELSSCTCVSAGAT